jgi:hypothetical protein
MTIVAEDDFTRTNTTTGWGTSTNSAGVTNYAWSNDGTGLAGVKIVSNKGQISDSASRYCLLDDGTTRQTGEIVVECTLDNTSDTFGALAAWHGTSGAGTDWYLARYDGAGHIAIMSRKSSSNATQASAAFTITTNHVYRIRFNIALNGSNQPVLSARIWDTSGAEPSTWNTAWTDTGSAVAAGHWGVYGFADSSLAHKALFSLYTLDDLAPAVTATATGQGSLSATGGIVVDSGAFGLSGQGYLVADTVPTATLSGQGSLSALGGVLVDAGAVSLGGSGFLVAVPNGAKTTGGTQTGTGTGPATFSTDTTHSVTWTAPSPGGTDTETDVVSANSAGDGWSLGSNTGYGGMPFSALFERAANAIVNSGQNSVNPGSQVTMATSVPDGHLHSLFQGHSGFLGSEDPNNWARTELAPTGTPIRRYIKAGPVTDVNGLTWTIYACIYPGDPGFIFWRLDVANNTASAITTASNTPDGFEIENPAGLLSNSGTGANQGVWSAASGLSYYGSLSTLTTTTPIPDGSTSNTPGEPDFLAFLPKQNVGTLTNQRLGLVTTKFTKGSDVGGLTSAGFASLSNSSRVKGKWGWSSSSIAAGASKTFYLCEAIRCNLSTADMLAIAADYTNPGSPAVTYGTLNIFNYPNHSSFPFNLDEGCYVITADFLNGVNITLDLGPAIIPNIRYKPRFKLTGWADLTQADGSELTVQYNGTTLTSGTDYNIAVDTANQVAYLQLQFDIVSSGAGAGQKNLAALVVTSKYAQGIASLSGQGALSATGGLVVTGTPNVLYGEGLLTTVGGLVVPSGAIPLGGSGYLIAWPTVDGGALGIGSQGYLSASAFQIIPAGAVNVLGQGSLVALGGIVVSGGVVGISAQSYISALSFEILDGGPVAIIGQGLSGAIGGLSLSSGLLPISGQGFLIASGIANSFSGHVKISGQGYIFTDSSFTALLTGQGFLQVIIPHNHLLFASAVTNNRIYASFNDFFQSDLLHRFVSTQRVRAIFTRSKLVPTPNSSISSTMRAWDKNNLPVTDLNTLSVLVTFPDQSTATYTLAANQVVNNGDGTYSVIYNTRGVGNISEVWTGTRANGDVGSYQNIVPVSY